MNNFRKYIIICIITIILMIPLFFGVFIEYFLIKMINLISLLILVLGAFGLLFLGFIIEVFAYNDQIFELIKKHDVINTLIHKNNKFVIWILFLITMLMEELIFRYYSIGILNSLLNIQNILIILISSLAFSFYHIHTWFSSKNLKILLINLIFPFLLGLYLGYIFFSFGFLPCIIAHSIIAFFLHYNLYRRYYKNKYKNNN